VSDARSRQLAAVSSALGSRRLTWMGIRGDDAQPLLALAQFSDCFSITSALRVSALEDSVSLEQLSGYRVDLDNYDIDLDPSPAVDQFRLLLMRSLSRSSALTTYRPSEFLSSLGFACRGSAQMLGMFKDRQRAFEHKPWVETELARRGIRTVDWEYVPFEYRSRLLASHDGAPVVVRPSRSSGGAGMSLVHDAAELERAWQHDSTHLMAVARYLETSVPINVGGCVFATGDVTLHPASVQLIGLPGYTNRRFGYCGNDFAALHRLGGGVAVALDSSTREVGRWLSDMGFIGAFGVDYLVDEENVLFTEVNPRMQGSTRMAAELAAATDHIDLLVDNVAAFLGLPPAESLTLTDWMAELPPAAQVIKHNLKPVPAPVPPVGDLALAPGVRARLLPDPGVRVEPGGVEYCLEVSHQVTETGFELLADLRETGSMGPGAKRPGIPSAVPGVSLS